MTHLSESPIIFPDAEKVVREYLVLRMPGIKIASRVPDPRPTSWLRVMRTGGARENRFVDRPQITLEGWGGTEKEAWTMLETGRAWLNAAGGQLFGVEEVGGPANLPDPTTAQIRYTMTLWVRIRGTALTGNES
jgi:hypothetical protein